MTLANPNTKITYSGDGNNRRWDIPFPLMDNGHLVVLVTKPNGQTYPVTNGVEVDSTGAFLTYPTLASELDPLAATDLITLLRVTPQTQENDLLQQAVLNKESLEKSLDKLTMVQQELAEAVARSVKYPPWVNNKPTDAKAYLDELEELAKTAQTAASAAAEAAEAALAYREEVKHLADHLADEDNPHHVTKAQVGLGNVDNTADLDKPISRAVQEALDGKQEAGAYATVTDLETKQDKFEIGDGLSLKDGVLVAEGTGTVDFDVLATVQMEDEEVSDD